MKRLLNVFGFVGFASAVGMFATASAAQSSGNHGGSAIVLSASGSMSDDLAGQPKIKAVQQGLAAIGRTWSAGQVAPALVVYGDQVQGECSDIDMRVLPGENTDLADVVGAVTPLGTAPLSASVRVAADNLRYTSSPARIVVLTDGTDTCNENPCVLGVGLAQQGVDLQIDVIGLGIDDGVARAELQCLAGATGGAYTDVTNAGMLSVALVNATKALIPTPMSGQQQAATDQVPSYAGAATSDILPQHMQPSDLVFVCEKDRCLVDLPEIDALQIPLSKGFAVAFPERTEREKPSFEVANLRSGWFIQVNPIMQAMGRTCIGFGADGYRDPENAEHVDVVCYFDSSAATGEDATQFENLEFWVSARNEAAYEDDREAERQAHFQAMGEDDPMPISGQWVLTAPSGDALGVVVFDKYELDAPQLRYSLILGDIERFGPLRQSLTNGRARLDWSPDSGIDPLRAQIIRDFDADRMIITFSRPKGWDGQNNEWEGFLFWKGGNRTSVLLMEKN